MKATKALIAIFLLVICTLTKGYSLSDSTIRNHKFRIGIDLLKPFSPSLQDPGLYRSKVEMLFAYKVVNALFLNLDFGYGLGFQKAYSDVQHYQSEGLYAKPGFDVNVLKGKDDRTSRFLLLLGYRHGLAFYNEKNQYRFKSEFWGTEYIEEENYKSFTNWHEFLISFRTNLIRTSKVGLSLGVTNRLRYKPQKADHSRLYIPGYGGNNPLNIAFNIDAGLIF